MIVEVFPMIIQVHISRQAWNRAMMLLCRWLSDLCWMIYVVCCFHSLYWLAAAMELFHFLYTVSAVMILDG